MKRSISPERAIRRALDGVVLLDKPLGMSSNQALQRVRHLYHASKAGHTGTLDPLATGLLPLCLGEATKYSGWILDAPKSYRATLCLGMTSDTGDGEGILTVGNPFAGDEKQVQHVLQSFLGIRQQIPPMYSALKVKGKVLYQLARQGESVVREPRTIQVHELELLDWHANQLTLVTTVSKGTYIRVLAEEIGDALGCGAYLSELQRVGTGPFQLSQAVTLETLEQESQSERDRHLLPVDSLLKGIPDQVLEVSLAHALSQGRVVEGNPAWAPGLYRAYDTQKRFYGLVQIDEPGGNVIPKRMMGERTQEALDATQIG
jgi:tRNA pseudouridine 55 synthase